MTEQEKIDAAVQAERDRCEEIVQMARGGEIDTDFRTIIHFIRKGDSIETIKRITTD